MFARYSLVGALVGASARSPRILRVAAAATACLAAPSRHVRALCAARLAPAPCLPRLAPCSGASARAAAPLAQSKRIVYTLAALFSLDAFGGGFVVQSLLALWLFQRFGLSVASAGAIFFWTGVLSAFSYLVARALAGASAWSRPWCSRTCRPASA